MNNKILETFQFKCSEFKIFQMFIKDHNIQFGPEVFGPWRSSYHVASVQPHDGCEGKQVRCDWSADFQLKYEKVLQRNIIYHLWITEFVLVLVGSEVSSLVTSGHMMQIKSVELISGV